MLIRKYAAFINLDGFPFRIWSSAADDGVLVPNAEVLAAPGLQICLFSGCDEKMRVRSPEQTFREKLRPGCEDSDVLAPEVVDAVCGKPSDWKVFRCELVSTAIGDAVHFDLVNPKVLDPEKCSVDGFLDEFYDHPDKHVAMGLEHVSLDLKDCCSSIDSANIEVTTAREDGGTEMYAIKCRQGFFEFVERDKDGRVRRATTFACDRVHVTTTRKVEVVEYIR